MFVQEWEEDFCSADEEQFMSEMGTMPRSIPHGQPITRPIIRIILLSLYVNACLALPFLAPLPPCLPRHQQQKERKYAERRKHLIS